MLCILEVKNTKKKIELIDERNVYHMKRYDKYYIAY